ncbi:glycosyl transferase [Arsukibacterium sp.]|uniref:glycosyl transferase n=1 Tax=Arsukibacterium sp. TaxID=1977258 RepID=UPI002FDA3BF6
MLAPGFYNGTAGKLFLYSQTANNTSALIILPPFADEMNKCRHLFQQLMQQLTPFGIDCFLPDHFGTGDSEGDLTDATIDIWRADLIHLLATLAAAGYHSCHLLAVRFGCLQALDLLQQPELPLPVQQLVLWQPQFDQTKFWQQFVRIKIAEAMAIGTKTSQSTIEQQLASGQLIEIAGYPLTNDFVSSLKQFTASLPEQLKDVQLSWFETSPLDNMAIPVQKMLAQLNSFTPVHYKQLKAEPYWQTTELASADELLHYTVQQLLKGIADE